MNMSDTMTSNNLPALGSLADRINAEHQACHSAMQKGLAHALEAGRLLLEAKAGLAHGEWLPWLEGNCPEISERTAQRYTRFADNRGELEAKSATVADLTMRAAEEALITPRGGESRDPHEAPRLSWSERMADSNIPPVDKAFLERCLGSMAQADYVIVREVGTALRETRDQELFKPRRTGRYKSNRVGLKGNPAYTTFEEYVSEELNMPAEVAEELIDAATMLNNPRAAIQAEVLTRIQQIAPGVSITPMGLDLPDGLSGAQWIEIGELLFAMPGCNLHDLGDKVVWRD